MVTIKCNPYERGELLRYLEYAKKKKQEEPRKENERFSEINYDIQRINHLIELVKGKYEEDYLDTMAKSGREKSGKIRSNKLEDVIFK